MRWVRGRFGGKGVLVGRVMMWLDSEDGEDDHDDGIRKRGEDGISAMVMIIMGVVQRSGRYNETMEMQQ